MTGRLQCMRALTVEDRDDLLSATDHAGLDDEIAAPARGMDAAARDATYKRTLFGAQAPAAAPAGVVATVARDDAMADAERLVDSPRST